jgi:hypothetical protein
MRGVLLLYFQRRRAMLHLTLQIQYSEKEI